MFKVGDKVFDIMRQEWGVVDRIDDSLYPINVRFEGEEFLCVYMADGRVSRHYKTPSLTFQEFYLPEGWQERPRWRAEKGEYYFIITVCGDVYKQKEKADDIDNALFRAKNYFQTAEEAKESKIYRAFHGEDSHGEK